MNAKKIIPERISEGFSAFGKSELLTDKIIPEYINIEIALSTAPVITKLSGSENPLRKIITPART